MSLKQKERYEIILSTVRTYKHDHGYSPSINEIAELSGIPFATVYRYLKSMNDQGVIKYCGGKGIVLEEDTFDSHFTVVPLYGSIPCGTPEEQEAQTEDMIRLPENLFSSKVDYVLRANGSSMEDLGIYDRDYVLMVRATAEQIRPGDVIAALINGTENTLKVYEGIDKNEGVAVLSYRNERDYPGWKIPARQLEVQGKAIGWYHSVK